MTQHLLNQDIQIYSTLLFPLSYLEPLGIAVESSSTTQINFNTKLERYQEHIDSRVLRETLSTVAYLFCVVIKTQFQCPHMMTMIVYIHYTSVPVS